MSVYKTPNPEGIYFTTTTVVDWIDVFTRKEHRLIVLDSLKYCQEHKGLIVYAYCLMLNHLHMICAAQEGFLLSDIFRDFKKFTAKAIIKAIEQEPESRRDWMLYRFEYNGKLLARIEKYKFWMDGNHAKELLDSKTSRQKLDYIHNNPVRAMIVEEPEHYLFSSARNYAGLPGLMDVEFLS